MLDVAVVRRSGPIVPSMERFADALDRFDAGFAADIRTTQIRANDVDPMRSRLFSQWQRWVVHPAALRRQNSPIYHVVDHSDAHLLRVLPGERTVVTCHDLLLLRAMADHIDFEARRWWGARFRWTISHLRRAAAVVCDSEATRGDVLRFCDVTPTRVHVVPMGVDEHFRPADPTTRRDERQKLGIVGRRAILHVTSGTFYKNSPVTLRVLAGVLERGVDAVLVRAGSAMSESEEDLAHSLGMSERVIRLGRVSEEELIRLYGATDVFLFPSILEGFGWPVLEAMASGLLVVTSCAPALEELAGPAGRRAPADDAEALADEVSAILGDDREADTLRRLGLERARGYGWQRTLSAYADIYRAIAGDKPIRTRCPGQPTPP